MPTWPEELMLFTVKIFPKLLGESYVKILQGIEKVSNYQVTAIGALTLPAEMQLFGIY
jgi:hypothetical protein